MGQERIMNILAFLRKAENLKNTLRSAHTTNGRQESTAEHSWRLSLLVLVFARDFEGINIERLLKLAIVHDLGEAVCGDIPAVHQSGIANKSILEREAMSNLCVDLPVDLQAELLDLWDEYEGGRSPESRIIKGLDKIETIIQHNQGKNPETFDYAFNLGYGQEYMDSHPLLRQIRYFLDEETKVKAKRTN